MAETETNRERRASRVCLCSHLGDDLAILSVDLSDASPLCQEGEDLVQLGGRRRTDRRHGVSVSNAEKCLNQVWEEVKEPSGGCTSAPRSAA